MNKDLNKGITSIQYNSLNLPRMMDIKSPVAEARNEYLYSAGGQKLKVTQKWNSNYSTAPVIGSAINTAVLDMTRTTDYVGNKVYEDGVLKRILVNGGYIEAGAYYFYQNDHLGNNRVVANASGTAIQKNHYYPFGMAFAETPLAEQQKQPFKYNGKELDQMHGLNLYDYSARQYDPAIGRFSSMDPLAEKHYAWAPYTYCLNNP
ncbi:MAG: RHS repeat-associated core domain-containing protein [Prevotella sp.]|jgi:RHS repeat-associated protein|nr:RHS repeat-associated core domain-containing protein [Prevotella sp.]